MLTNDCFMYVHNLPVIICPGLKPAIYYTRGKHADYAIYHTLSKHADHAIYHTRGKHADHAIYHTRGKHADHYNTNAVLKDRITFI